MTVAEIEKEGKCNMSLVSGSMMKGSPPGTREATVAGEVLL